MTDNKKIGFFQSGTPWVWLNAGAVSISMIMVIGLLVLIVVRGLGHFWPKAIWQIEYEENGGITTLVGERAKTETVSARQLREAGIKHNFKEEFVERTLLKIGNRDVYGFDFRLTVAQLEKTVSLPQELIVLERT